MSESLVGDKGRTAEGPQSVAPPPGGAKAGQDAGFLPVLRNRSFVAVWTAQILSQSAQNCLWFALIIMVGHLTGQTPAGIGFTIILVQLPTVLFSSISGVLVDRMSKRVILVGTNLIRVMGVLLYLVFQDYVTALYLITFLVAVVSQPFAPAEGSTLPLLVDGEQLITANSLFQTTFMASQAVGFALGPIIIGLFGIRITLIVLAVMFALAALALVPLPPITDRHAPGSLDTLRASALQVWKDLSDATRFILRDSQLVIALLQLSLAPTLLLVLAEVGPDFLTHTLHIGQTSTGLFFLLAPAGIGVGLGIFVLGQWGHRLRKERLVLVSFIALGCTVVGLAAVPILATFYLTLARLGLPIPSGVQYGTVMVPIAALLGFEVAFINAPVQTIVQQRATDEMRGRVLAMQQTLSAAMAILPLILIGAFASLVGTPATLTLGGVAIIIAGLVIVYYA